MHNISHWQSRKTPPHPAFPNDPPYCELEVLVSITIVRKSDGMLVMFDDWVAWEGDSNRSDGWPNTYIWEGGNNSCDCNRSLYFERKRGVPEDEIVGAECGHGAYAITIKNPMSGEVVYEDDDFDVAHTVTEILKPRLGGEAGVIFEEPLS